MRFVAKIEFKNLIDGLIKDFTVFGPIKKHGFPAFARINEFKELKLNLTPTHLSAKEFLFPPAETLLRFDIEKNLAEPVVEKTHQAVIGLHSCDIHAVNLLDRVFSYSTPDVNYLERRKNTIIIGTECAPDGYCFCNSIGTMTVDKGFDLFFHEVKNGFIMRIGSRKGEKILKKYAKTRTAGKRELEELSLFTGKKSRLFKKKINAEAKSLPLIYSGADSHPVWERIGKICYGCGSCNHVCPTCYCFDVKDDVAIDLKNATRSRLWDACTTEDFAKISGGFNFRKTRAERLRHRFNRKFRYLADRFKGLFCVGCGRCSRTCLVKINITDVTNEIISSQVAVSAEKGEG